MHIINTLKTLGWVVCAAAWIYNLFFKKNPEKAILWLCGSFLFFDFGTTPS